MEDILDFWFRVDDDGGITGMLAYDRETSLPKSCMKRWFKPDNIFDK